MASTSKLRVNSAVIILIVLSLLSHVPQAEAASRRITGRVTAGSAAKIIAITSKGSKTASVNAGGSFSITLPSGAKTARLAFTKDSAVVGYLYAPRCSTAKRCTNSKLSAEFIVGASLPAAKFSSTTGRFTVGQFKTLTLYRKSVSQTFVNSSSAASGKNLGLVSLGGASIKGGPRTLVSSGLDSDGDGAADLLDVDDDNDSISDNYDTSTPSAPADESFKIFSNLKVELENVVNVNTGTASTTLIDNLMTANTTLAIQVLASSGETSELNCGSLGYCSAGGTGVSLAGNTAFPGAAGGSSDVDSDGFGEITAGGTGDFQLRPGATSAQIGAGDSILQLVTNGTTTQEVPGMLNFVFNTTPALKSVQVNSETPVEFSYPIASNAVGTLNNCIPVPASGDVKVAVVAWRPQRAGLTGAGEAEFVDLGNSTITVDIPNAPCSTGISGGCSGSGPGLCGGSTYTTTDSNLNAASEGLSDTLGDVASSTSNTFSFTLDLDDCLSNRSVAWSSGEKVTIDLQLRNAVGDNAAVKACFRRL